MALFWLNFDLIEAEFFNFMAETEKPGLPEDESGELEKPITAKEFGGSFALVKSGLANVKNAEDVERLREQMLQLMEAYSRVSGELAESEAGRNLGEEFEGYEFEDLAAAALVRAEARAKESAARPARVETSKATAPKPIETKKTRREKKRKDPELEELRSRARATGAVGKHKLGTMNRYQLQAAISEFERHEKDKGHTPITLAGRDEVHRQKKLTDPNDPGDNPRTPEETTEGLKKLIDQKRSEVGNELTNDPAKRKQAIKREPENLRVADMKDFRPDRESGLTHEEYVAKINSLPASGINEEVWGTNLAAAIKKNSSEAPPIGPENTDQAEQDEREDREFAAQEFEKEMDRMLDEKGYPQELREPQREIWRKLYKENYIEGAIKKSRESQ